MKKEINWGIIGLGKIANKFATALTHVENARLYAVASRNRDKAVDISEEHNAKVAYGVYEQLMKDENVDVIYIATPHSFHHKLSLECIKHGKAVLCEKPFAMNRKEAEEMIALARSKDIFLMEALWTMFLPHYQFLLDTIKSGAYGKIRSLKADFGFEAEFDRDKRLFNKSLGGGSLLDIGIYPIFLAYSLLGKPEKIEAIAKFAETGVDMECEMKFMYDDAQASLHSSFKEKTPTIAEITLEKAVIKLHSRFHEPTSISIISEGNETTKDFNVETNGYNFEAAHVTQMLLEGKSESSKWSHDETLDLMELLDNVRREIGLKY
ncbi:Gfo/Idh/MocA family oxidoreductase [Gramella jeungdoensis]|uniref:Gfo/Idh/MocA family oxidoreductase n=1 Tax=Gramella jeungdoensis TaxID=708091 RepID=A0ABT0Z3D9_9FLAO|nr:Gfo/Idh/MocA family oxidoreductase [Gramella jeungdoensis]MCM8569920.1 Gfo/Idh/MocA family oxidoreductase [Gramella jeungdoensis]